ncbi:murein hydrolase activator EnvC family protein, partial [candidate division CSSED10-310 bacterium]
MKIKQQSIYSSFTWHISSFSSLKARLTLIVCFTLLLFSSLAQAAPDAAESLAKKEQKLLQIQRNLKNNLQKLEQFKEKEQTLLDDLEKLDFELELINTNIRLLELKKIRFEDEREAIKQEIGKRKTEIHQQESILCKRLKVMYTRGEWTALRLLFNTQSISDIARNIKIMKFIARTDLSLIKQHQRCIQILSQRTTDLENLDHKVLETAKNIGRNKKELLKKKRLKEIYYQKIHNQKVYHEQRQQQLTEAAEKLENFILNLHVNKKSGTFELLKKHLPWP